MIPDSIAISVVWGITACIDDALQVCKWVRDVLCLSIGNVKKCLVRIATSSKDCEFENVCCLKYFALS